MKDGSDRRVNSRLRDETVSRKEDPHPSVPYRLATLCSVDEVRPDRR